MPAYILGKALEQQANVRTNTSQEIKCGAFQEKKSKDEFPSMLIQT